MTRNQATDDETPVVYEDDMDELAELMFKNPDHPRVQELKRRAEEIESEHVDLRETNQ